MGNFWASIGVKESQNSYRRKLEHILSTAPGLWFLQCCSKGTGAPRKGLQPSIPLQGPSGPVLAAQRFLLGPLLACAGANLPAGLVLDTGSAWPLCRNCHQLDSSRDGLTRYVEVTRLGSGVLTPVWIVQGGFGRHWDKSPRWWRRELASFILLLSLGERSNSLQNKLSSKSDLLHKSFAFSPRLCWPATSQLMTEASTWQENAFLWNST